MKGTLLIKGKGTQGFFVILIILVLLIQGIHAGYISGSISGEPLYPGSSDDTGVPADGTLNEGVTMKMVNLPLSFLPNEGQCDPDVLFIVKGSGTAFAFTRNGMVFSMQNTIPDSSLPPAVISQAFVGSNDSVSVIGEETLPGTANFFIGNDPDAWHTDLPMFGAVRYCELYPGIDLVYRGNGSVLKREFIVRAGSDPGRIRMKYSGADSLSLDPSGALKISAGTISMTESMPVCYQEKEGNRVEIDAHYLLTRPDEVRIQPDRYDPTYPLVIDPDLLYSGYLGGTGSDYGYGIALDPEGNTYITGETTGSFPNSSTAFQSIFGGGEKDAFITKLNPTGSGIVYSTYLGGYMEDYGRDIAVDSAGCAYVTGTSYGPTTNGYGVYIFPVTPGAVLPEENVWEDAFVTKLNPSGNSLVFSGKLGAEGDDYGEGIAVDSSGNVYVTGRTDVWGLNMTPNMTKPAIGEGAGFVVKLNPTCTSILYYTRMGTSNSAGGKDIAVDSAGNAYVVGTTDGMLTTTPGAFQTSSGGREDAFVMKLNETGSILYSTYLGGAGIEEGNGIAINSVGNAFVTGRTRIGGIFPTTPGAFQTIRGSGDDVFVTKLSPSGDSLVYSTYIGGSQDDQGHDIALDSAGNAYVAGFSKGAYNVTAGAYQTGFAGGVTDAFITKLDPTGSYLRYSTYLGGAGRDQGLGIALDPTGIVHMTGSTDGSFPASGSFGGAYDAFVVKFQIPEGASPAPTIASITPNTGTNTGAVSITNLAGAYFSTAIPPTVKLNRTGQGDIMASGVNVLSSSKITCTFNLAGKSAGKWNVVVINPDGQAGMLYEGFTITASSPHYGVFRPSTHYNWIYSDTLVSVKNRNHYGIPGDKPLIADFNNDGITDRAVFRNGNWILDYAMDGTVNSNTHFGLGTDIPVVGDFNNDGVTDRGVFRNGQWIIDRDMDGDVDTRTNFGTTGDVPLVGDFNNDGVTDRGVFRKGQWIIDLDMDGDVDARNNYGISTDIPLAGDFNNDGVMDRAIFRAGEWVIDYNMDNSVNARPKFGTGGDVPLVWTA